MTLKLNGSSSGYTAIDAPAAAGSNTLVLPANNGSANQYLKNSGTAGTLEFASLGATGKILQVVTDTSTTQINETNDFPQASGVSVNITPAATGNNILLIASFQCHLSGGTNNDRIGLYGIRDEGNTIIAQFRFGASSSDEAGQNIFGSNTIHRMYSPNTTSQKTYTLVYGRYSSTYNNTVSLNGGGGGDNRTTLTAIEVGA
jgi:hypothetical protein